LVVLVAARFVVLVLVFAGGGKRAARLESRVTFTPPQTLVRTDGYGIRGGGVAGPGEALWQEGG